MQAALKSPSRDRSNSRRRRLQQRSLSSPFAGAPEGDAAGTPLPGGTRGPHAFRLRRPRQACGGGGRRGAGRGGVRGGVSRGSQRVGSGRGRSPPPRLTLPSRAVPPQPAEERGRIAAAPLAPTPATRPREQPGRGQRAVAGPAAFGGGSRTAGCRRGAGPGAERDCPAGAGARRARRSAAAARAGRPAAGPAAEPSSRLQQAAAPCPPAMGGTPGPSAARVPALPRAPPRHRRRAGSGPALLPPPHLPFSAGQGGTRCLEQSAESSF